MAPFSLKYDDAFWVVLKNVIGWYERISPNVCNNFLDEFDFLKNRLLSNPLSFAKAEKTSFWRILFKKFPYKIFFRIEEEKVFVVALIHAKRSNKHIKTRLKK